MLTRDKDLPQIQDYYANLLLHNYAWDRITMNRDSFEIGIKLQIIALFLSILKCLSNVLKWNLNIPK
jgi:hypothetical protein